MLIILYIAIIIVLFVFFGYSIYTTRTIIPVEVTSTVRLNALKKILRPMKKKRAVDLGSGNGKVSFELAKFGLYVHGIEFNPVLVIWAQLRSKGRGNSKKVKFIWKSFWNVSLTPYDLVFIYKFPSIMTRLEKKMEEELNDGTMVISVGFKLPNWKHDEVIEGMYIYRR